MVANMWTGRSTSFTGGNRLLHMVVKIWLFLLVGVDADEDSCVDLLPVGERVKLEAMIRINPVVLLGRCYTL